MKLALAVLVLAVRAGAVAAAPAKAPGYVASYLGGVGRSLSADPFYASRLLGSLSIHVEAVAAMRAPEAVKTYLERESLAGAPSAAAMRASLDAGAVAPSNAAALLLSNALARPDQWREAADGLETLRPGLGKAAAKVLRDASGPGHPQLLALLRGRGALRPRGDDETYSFARLGAIFDGAAALAPPPSEGALVVAPPASGKPRPSGLVKARP